MDLEERMMLQSDVPYPTASFPMGKFEKTVIKRPSVIKRSRQLFDALRHYFMSYLENWMFRLRLIKDLGSYDKYQANYLRSIVCI